ncbi:peptidase [Endozoicomonas numazuensis]|uniref:Peptidase n=2 Tax=Endozoicomonas numazuensis TaxID=1137799 RepID=A0A081NJF5_9GAMM|nr:peptidase [Endozoicomonas numazuensis]
MTSSRPYIARALYDWILENDCTPYILVDAARKGVEVPREYVKDGQIVLNVSPAAVRAMHMGNDVITFDGRFGGEALTIMVPVEALMAIYARENGQGMVFEVEPFSEIEEEVSPHFELEAVSDPEPQEASVAAKEEESDKPPRKPGRPHLKVVK